MNAALPVPAPGERSRPLRRFVRAGTSVALAPAALAALLSIATAQQRPGAAEDLLETLNLKAKVAPASEFVERSRPKTTPGFIPIGTPHAGRAVKVMSPAEVAATEADLDRARETQQRRAGHRAAVVPLKPAAGAAKTTNR